MSASIRIAIVEDHALTRAGMATLLAAEYELAGEAADGNAGIALVERTHPDVAVVDLGLPDVDGIAVTQAIRARSPQTRVVIMTMIDVADEVLAALAAGADAYCLKSSSPQTLIDAVRIASEGGAYFDPRIAHVVLGRFAPRRSITADGSPLTPRELDVLRLIAEGRANAEIGRELSIGLGTVKGHIRDILEKLSAADRTQAAVVALRRGLI